MEKKDLQIFELTEEQKAGAKRFDELPLEEQQRLRDMVNNHPSMQSFLKQISELNLNKKKSQPSKIKQYLTSHLS